VFIADEVFRGVGGTMTVKSRLLLSVSVQPPEPRAAEEVAEIVPAGPAPSKKFAPLAPVPYPTRSTMFADWAAVQGVDPPLHPRVVAMLASATLPAPAAIWIGEASTRSAVGSGEPTAAWLASCTK